MLLQLPPDETIMSASCISCIGFGVWVFPLLPLSIDHIIELNNRSSSLWWTNQKNDEEVNKKLATMCVQRKEFTTEKRKKGDAQDILKTKKAGWKTKTQQ